MPKLYVPGIVHVLSILRDDETGDVIEFDIGVYEHECIIIEPLSGEGDSMARVMLKFRGGGVWVEMAGPMIESVKVPGEAWHVSDDLGPVEVS